MRLRTRLAVSVVAAAVPLAAATVVALDDLESRRVAQVLREFAVTRMEAGGRARCESDPVHFPPPAERAPRDPSAPPLPPPLPEIGPLPVRDETAAEDVRTDYWAYGPDLVSANPDAPALDAALVAGLRPDDAVALREIPGGHEALVRMPWDGGPCALLLVRRRGPDTRVAALELWWAGAVVAGGVLVAVLLASGPVVRRIRRLERDVRAAAADRYGGAVPVDGADEVADLARAFNDAAGEIRGQLAEVERREETLRSFVANTTHDVMTPLTVLAGHLDALGPSVPPADTAARESLRDALSEVDYTTSLVANLATAAKLEAGERAVSSHPVDLTALVERVAARYRPVARARDVELNHAVPAEVVSTPGDVTLLEQAVGNVVQNAIRYNRPGGHVALVLRSEPPRGFEIRVVDDGPGLSDGDLARLTTRGFRGSAARSRGPGGHGLGLDITRGVCGRLGIELRFERPDHGGLTVTFRGDGRPAAEA